MIRQDLRFVNRMYNLYNYTSRAVQLKQKIFHKLVDKRKGCRFIIYNIRAKIFVWGDVLTNEKTIVECLKTSRAFSRYRFGKGKGELCTKKANSQKTRRSESF